jgi:hypothetical protein
MYFKVYLQFRLHTMNVKGDRSFSNIVRSSARAVCDITDKARIQLTKTYLVLLARPVVTPDERTYGISWSRYELARLLISRNSVSGILNFVLPQFGQTASFGNTKIGGFCKSFSPGKWTQISPSSSI